MLWLVGTSLYRCPFGGSSDIVLLPFLDPTVALTFLEKTREKVNVKSEPNL